jgi:hypothetical protein
MTEDRWEAFGDYDDDRKFNEGVVAERERIIALLDKTLIYDEPVVIDRDRLIALINGENNA